MINRYNPEYQETLSEIKELTADIPEDHQGITRYKAPGAPDSTIIAQNNLIIALLCKILKEVRKPDKITEELEELNTRLTNLKISEPGTSSKEKPQVQAKFWKDLPQTNYRFGEKKDE